MNFNQLDSLLPVPTGAFKISEIQKTSIKLSLVLPTYNEGKNIEKMVKILTKLLDSRIPEKYELIVVDDDSPDLTWKLALALLSDYPQLRVMRRVGERGLATAVIRGWQVAQGEVLGVMDADLQHPPEVLLQLYHEMERGADLAVASRHVEGGGVSEWSIWRRLLSRGAQMLGWLILPEVISSVSDPMSGYFLVRRNSIVNNVLTPVGYKILIEVVARGNMSWIAETGYVFQERFAGASKVTWKQYLEYIQHLFQLRLALLPVARFFCFGMVGLSGVFVDMALLFLLSDPTTLALPLTRSKIISSQFGMINNFFWHDFWTFRDISQRQPGKLQRLKRFFKFNLVGLGGLVLNILFLNLFFRVFGLNRYVANFLAIAFVTFWNFGLNSKLSWRVTDLDKSP